MSQKLQSEISSLTGVKDTPIVDNQIQQMPTEISDAPCWGPEPAPRSGGFERPGYTINPFISGFVDTVIGPVPRVFTNLSYKDHIGTIGARTGFFRNNYTIVPGLYCTGSPNVESPVIVTANYKLSFDAVRKELAELDTWILVVDTRGINVWCAAGKGTFSAEEVAFQVHRTHLEQVVNHRELILPQLCANGVKARTIKKRCGFKGTFGPILASNLPQYIETRKVDEQMRSVTFTIKERLVLIPLELCMLLKPLLLFCLVFFVLSGISPDFFSLDNVFTRGKIYFYATIAGVIAGAVITPILLPWLFFRQFWLKGALAGGLAAVLFLLLQPNGINSIETVAIFIWIVCCSSYLAMNFTGSTPFTSLSGVAKEMQKGLAFQLSSATLAALLWLVGPFL